MWTVRLCLIVLLIISPIACATNQHEVKGEEYVTQVEKEEATFWDKVKFIGAVCLVGLFYPTEPKEKYKVREMEDGIPAPTPKYEVEKERR
jgi:hypothetical protein